MFGKIVMCVFVASLLGMLAAVTENAARSPHGQSDLSDGQSVVVAVSASWSPVLVGDR